MIADKEIIALVEEQKGYFINGGTQAQKIDVQRRIEKRQKVLMRRKNEDT
jgi:threonine aldolase